MPRISVIIAARNAEQTLGRVLDGLMAQTFKDFEVIVVDDSSTDQTETIARDHPISAIVIVNSANRGRGASRNSAISVASGEYLAIHDADDWSMPNRLALTLDAAETSGAVVSGGQLLNIARDGSRWTLGHYPLDSESIANGLKAGRMSCAHPASLIRRDAFDLVGGYDHTLERAQDLDLFRRLVHVGSFINVPDVVVFYDHHWYLSWKQWRRHIYWHQRAMGDNADAFRLRLRRNVVRYALSMLRRYRAFVTTRTAED